MYAGCKPAMQALSKYPFLFAAILDRNMFNENSRIDQVNNNAHMHTKILIKQPATLTAVDKAVVGLATQVQVF